ncbi:unnamed protein product [Ectocarpus sp. 12 AP-2014]
MTSSRVVRCLGALLLLPDALLTPRIPGRWGTAAHLLVTGRLASSTPGTAAGAPSEEAVASAVARGQELLLGGLLHEAADVLEGVLESEPEEPKALLHLAQALSQLGHPVRAAELLDRLLGLGQLTPESRSFVLNRRGIYLMAANDFTAARQSYERALDGRGHGHINRHALYNLARLLHFHILPSEITIPDFSIIERAIELYREALGPGGDGIGGPIDRSAVLRDMAAALMLAGRVEEAIAELEYATADLSEDLENATTSSISSKRYCDGDADKSGGVEEEALTTAETAARNKTAAFLWDSLSSARSAAGDVSGAVAAGRKALNLVGDEPGLYHNMAVLFQKAGLLEEARDAWLTAVALDPVCAPALTGLGHLEGARGNIGQAREFYEASLVALRSPEVGNISGHSHITGQDGQLISMFLVATAVIPAFCESNDHIAKVRRDFESGLDHLLGEPMDAASTGVERPSTTVGSGALGYYIIYQQGFEDVGIRRKLARAYWKFAPSLRYCAPFLANDGDLSTGHHAPRATSDVPVPGELGPPTVGELPEEPQDSLNRPTDRADVPPPGVRAAPTQPPATGIESMPAGVGTASKAQEDLDGTGSRNPQVFSSSPPPCRRRRIRVGFLSAFFYTHSVGLLVEGVVTRLDRQRFETTAIFLQPHPSSASSASSSWRGSREGGVAGNGGDGKENSAGRDRVYDAVRTGVEHVLDVPLSSLAACRHAIASLQLDVLVFTEIGMNFESYFLSFARLARRSAAFWGHAVTSGISAFDALSTPKGDADDPSPAAGAQAASVGVADDDAVGGVDYFVSSWLFEDVGLGRRAQRKYSERLYLMKGLSTRFGRPAPSVPGLVTRKSLGIPPRILPPTRSGSPSQVSSAGTAVATPTGPASFEAGGDASLEADEEPGRTAADGRPLAVPPTCGALYLVPQTLYKLHPDFDQLVAGVLSADPSGCAVFIRALEAYMTEGLARRMSRTLLAAGVELERVVFVPRVGLKEFSGLVELADVVLDPFPVGGGRSSLEIFAVGVPIVMLYNRTSILQLTYGMYATMGLEGAVGQTTGSNGVAGGPVSLVTYSEDQFIRSAVAVGTDAGLNGRSRELILANNHLLYEQDTVITEWEDFLEGIVSVPRPAATELGHGRHKGLAVDVSDFPAKLPWCSNNSSSSSSSYHGIPRDNESVNGEDRHSPPHQAQKQAVPSAGEGLDELWNSAGGIAVPEGVAATEARTQSKNIGQIPTETSASTVSAATAPSLSSNSDDPQPSADDVNGNNADVSNNRVSDSGLVGDDLAAAKPSSEVHGPQPSGVNVDGNGNPDASADGDSDGSLVRDDFRSEPIYAIEFSVAPAREGEQPSQLLAELYHGSNPIEVADRLREEGALDYLQYRWIGAVLCRGTRRLNRPVVWSTYVRIDGGPRRVTRYWVLLEVRQGDELYQVARWHCRRYSLGPERIPVLNTRLEKELPQHADPEWISSRAEDRACSMPEPTLRTRYSSSISSDGGTMGNSPLPISRASNGDRRETLKTSPVLAPRGASKGFPDQSGVWGSDQDGDNGDDSGCVTLAITTCKRLRAFLGTAEGLQAFVRLNALLGPLPRGEVGRDIVGPRICQVLVVDDGSSPKDRGVMMSAFPQFTYVFKGAGDAKGHAGSMNLVLSLTKTRYLMYVEDDWWVIHDNDKLPTLSGPGNILWRAMEVLRRSSERVSQASKFSRVLLNDQSTRHCAWGDTVTCTPEVQGTLSGWPRLTHATSVSPLQRGRRLADSSNMTATVGDDDIANNRCRAGGGSEAFCDDKKIRAPQPPDHGVYRDSTSARKSSADESAGVEYRLHEFGLLSPLSTFAYWPGFSLNPALWDLARLDGSYRRKYGREMEFNESDIRFEQSISMELLDAGVAVAHLPDLTFRHVGGMQSAYEANNMRRPWD